MDACRCPSRIQGRPWQRSRLPSPGNDKGASRSVDAVPQDSQGTGSGPMRITRACGRFQPRKRRRGENWIQGHSCWPLRMRVQALPSVLPSGGPVLLPATHCTNHSLFHGSSLLSFRRAYRQGRGCACLGLDGQPGGK